MGRFHDITTSRRRKQTVSFFFTLKGLPLYVKLISHDLNQGAKYPCLSSFTVNNPTMSRKIITALEKTYELGDVHTCMYAWTAVMILPINGKLTIGELKSSRLSYSFVWRLPPLSNPGEDQGMRQTCEECLLCLKFQAHLSRWGEDNHRIVNCSLRKFYLYNGSWN